MCIDFIHKCIEIVNEFVDVNHPSSFVYLVCSRLNCNCDDTNYS